MILNLYFVGFLFQRALSSARLGGVGADAADIIEQVKLSKMKASSS